MTVAAPASAPGDVATPWVFDADGHVVEPADMWDQFLPGRFRTYAPRVLDQGDHFRFICNDRLSFRIEGRPSTLASPGVTAEQKVPPKVAKGADDPGARLVDMDTDLIGAAALYPTFGLMIQGVVEPEPALALCRAINDWIAAYVERDRARLVGVGVLPMTSTTDARGEARRCVEELGFRGVWRRPEQFPGIPALHDPGYDALWGYLAEASVAFAFHPGVNGLIPFGYLQDRYGDYYSPIHAVHFPAEQMMALTTMVAYGILERHPALRVAFLETGAAWAVPYLHRLDEHLETFGFDRGGLTMKPSEYFARQCYVSVEEVEPGLDEVLRRLPTSVVFASDYPHGDGKFPGSTTDLLAAGALPAAQVQSVMLDNARRLYGLHQEASR